MKIKSKNDVLEFINNIENFFVKLASGQYSFYFYDLQNHNYIIKEDSNYTLKIISDSNNTLTTKEIDDINVFVWNNRKYINKYIDKDVYTHYFADLKKYY